MTKYKQGDKVVIVDRIYGHHFDIGEVVKIDFLCNSGDYDAANGKPSGKWFIADKEVKPYEN